MAALRAALLAGLSAAAHACSPMPCLEHVGSVVDHAALSYPVESRIYPEDPMLLWVTLRGGGLSVWDLTAPATPRLHAAWYPAPLRAVEGQDRRANLLVAMDISDSILHTFDADHFTTGIPTAGIAPRASLNLTHAGGLHVKLYSPVAGRTYAIVTHGLGHHSGTGHVVTAVDVSDPSRPVEVASLETSVKCTEGVLVVGDVAYIGGYCSNTFASVALAGLLASPPRLVELQQVTRPYFDNMVSAVWNASYERAGPAAPSSPADGAGAPRAGADDIFVSALYTQPGGLAVFSAGAAARANGSIVELSHFVDARTARANRVHLSSRGPPGAPHERYALLANEKEAFGANNTETGGVCLLAIAQAPPYAVRLLDQKASPDAGKRLYCGAMHPKAAYAYALSSRDTMHVYAIRE